MRGLIGTRLDEFPLEKGNRRAYKTLSESLVGSVFCVHGFPERCAIV